MATPMPMANAGSRLSRTHCAILVFVATVLAELVSISVWMPAPESHMLWLPVAVLTSVTLTHPTTHWPACVISWTLALLATLLVFGIPWGPILLVLAGEAAFVMLSAWVLLHVSHGNTPLHDFRVLWLFLLVCGVALPSAAASWTIWVSSGTELGAHFGQWSNLALAHSLANLLVVPLWISHARGEYGAGDHRLAKAVLTLAMFIVLGLSWVHLSGIDLLRPLLLIAPAPLVVWALIAYRARGACYAMLATALLCLELSVLGEGPFVQATVQETTLACQLWVAWSTVSMLFLASLAEQRVASQLALRRTHGELSRVTGRLIVAQETERRRIARDLHDDINQTLASVSIRLSSIKQDMEGAAREALEGMQYQLNGVSKAIRRLSHQLHPSVLRYTGLMPALQDLCEAIRQERGAHVHVVLNDSIHLPDAHALCLYRIAQEALANARKHADASEIELTLNRVDKGVQLCVADNGKGWDNDLAAVRARGGLGLLSMEERARALGGCIEVRPGPGGGTIVAATLPLSPSMDEATEGP